MLRRAFTVRCDQICLAFWKRLSQNRSTRGSAYRKCDEFGFQIKAPTLHSPPEGFDFESWTGYFFFFFFFTNRRSSSSQTRGVTVRNQIQTNVQVDTVELILGDKRRNEAVSRRSVPGCRRRWTSDMGCRVLRRDWRWAAWCRVPLFVSLGSPFISLRLEQV